jgi:hypothetical protein
MSDMILPVSFEKLEWTRRESNSTRPGSILTPKAIAHASLIDLCDPTHNCAIPVGHVFVTGIVAARPFVTEVIVARFPCPSRYDQRTLPIVQEKPVAMLDEVGAELMERSFGEIIFGNLQAGNVPIPENYCQWRSRRRSVFRHMVPASRRRLDTRPDPTNTVYDNNNDSQKAWSVFLRDLLLLLVVLRLTGVFFSSRDLLLCHQSCHRRSLIGNTILARRVLLASKNPPPPLDKGGLLLLPQACFMFFVG